MGVSVRAKHPIPNVSGHVKGYACFAPARDDGSGQIRVTKSLMKAVRLRSARRMLRNAVNMLGR